MKKNAGSKMRGQVYTLDKIVPFRSWQISSYA